MRHFLKLCFVIGALLACSVQADTIPTLTATSGNLSWGAQSFGTVSGPDFVLFTQVTSPLGPSPCPGPVAPGGCMAPGPVLYLQAGPNYLPASGQVTLGGTSYGVGYEGNTQIQYATPVITWPDQSNPLVTVPVVLSGSEMACLLAPNHTDLDLCSNNPPTPDYPQFIANVQITLPGTLTLYGGGPFGTDVSLVKFTSTPIQEPGKGAFICIGLLFLTAAKYRRRGQRAFL